MKKILGNLMLAAVAVVGMSSAANAATTCINQQVTAGFTCSIGSLTFDFLTLSFGAQSPPSTGDTLTLAPPTGQNGNSVVLGFQINPGTSGVPVDLLLEYTVTSTSANITGIDASYAGPDGTITETAFANDSTCAGPTGCTTVLSQLFDGHNNGNVDVFGNPATFGPVSSIVISKDIDDLQFSEFTDSVTVSSVPEPMTLSMMGAGLLGLSLISRRRKKS
jgi:opacity protein-like surface antigen